MLAHPLVRLLAVTVCVLVLGMPSAAAAQNDRKPQPVDETPFTLEGICAFPIQLELSGKGKTIELPGGRTLVTSPGLRVTVTNLDNPDNQVTLNITGAFHQSVRENGDQVTKATGRNLLLDPEAGFVLTRGNFSFAFDAQGNLIEPLSGQGQMTDVCELIS